MLQGARARVWCAPRLSLCRTFRHPSARGALIPAQVRLGSGFWARRAQDCGVPVPCPWQAAAGAVHALRASWTWHRGAQTTLCPSEGGAAASCARVGRRCIFGDCPGDQAVPPGCVPSRAVRCCAVSEQCVAERQLAFRAEMPLASHQRWRSGTVLEEVQ